MRNRSLQVADLASKLNGSGFKVGGSAVWGHTAYNSGGRGRTGAGLMVDGRWSMEGGRGARLRE